MLARDILVVLKVFIRAQRPYPFYTVLKRFHKTRPRQYFDFIKTRITMILVHIITKKNEQALEIIDLLIHKKLLFDAMVSEKTVYKKSKVTGKLVSSLQTLVIGRTKSLLFNAINQLLMEKYIDHMPVLYSLPIVYMQPEQAEEILSETVRV